MISYPLLSITSRTVYDRISSLFQIVVPFSFYQYFNATFCHGIKAQKT